MALRMGWPGPTFKTEFRHLSGKKKKKKKQDTKNSFQIMTSARREETQEIESVIS
jgi:hypothetical protein